jgi:septin family protein
MPLLTVDPTKNVCPSYDGEDHEFVRVAIIASHVGDPLTIKAAIAKLQDAWKRANDKRVTQWNEQLEEEQQRQRDEACQLEEEMEQRQLQLEKEEEERRKEVEKKKPKINGFDL